MNQLDTIGSNNATPIKIHIFNYRLSTVAVKPKASYTLILSVVTIAAAFCQGFSYKRFTTKEGLPSNEIGHISQDKQGYIWFISGDNLVRYDGLKFLTVSDKKYHGWALFNENIVYSPKSDHFIFTSGNNVVTAKYKFNYYGVDSALIYYYDREKEASKLFDVYVNKDGYVVFARDKCHEEYCTSDSLYYWFEGKLTNLRFPKDYGRNDNMKILLQDVDKNIYVRLINKTTGELGIFSFNQGKLQKAFSLSTNLKLDSYYGKIVKDKKGNYWIYRDTAIHLIKSGKIVRTFAYSEFKNDLLSSPAIDSKNDLWISSENCLLRFNEAGVKIFDDPIRRPKELVEYRFDANGNEHTVRRKTYQNFYQTNLVDRFDNIFNSYRMFDGHTFSDWGNRWGEFTNDFWRSGKDLSGDNSIDLLEAFADNQDNIWFSTSKGLVLASPTPYKCIDLTFSYTAQNYKLATTDAKGRKYYLKTEDDSALARLAVVDKGQINHYKFGLSKEYESRYFNLTRFGNGVLIETSDKKGNFTINALDNTLTEKYKIPGKYYKVVNYRDTVVYYANKTYVVGTKDNWYSISDSSMKESYFSFGFDNKMITTTLDYFQVNGKKIIKGKLVNYNAKDTSIKHLTYSYILWDPIVPLRDTVYAFNQYFKVYRKAGKTETIFTFEDNDTLLTKIKNERPWQLFRINVFKDLILLSTQQNGVLIYKLNEKNKKLEFRSLLDYSSGLPAKNEYYMVVQGNYLSVWSPFPNCLKVWPYESIRDAAFDNAYEYIDFSVDVIDAFPRLNSLGQVEVNSMISFVGSRGFNSLPPPIMFNEISYMSGKELVRIQEVNVPAKLNADFHDLLIEFKGISLAEGNKLKYKTRLLGFDKEWSLSPAENNFIKYPSLSPGSYTFEVTACNNHGVWSKAPVSFAFEVMYPFYRTWWAYLSYVIVGGLSIYYVIKWRTKKLENEKLNLEQTVEERTREVVIQKEIAVKQMHVIEEKHREITDSINYAERIQKSFLATKELLDQHLKEYFVFFKPKDIVSGDFYWAGQLNNGLFALVTADSTGHGVPGAIMSLLNITSIEKAMEHHTEPADILNHTRRIIIDRLKKDGSVEGGKDGMDCVFISFDLKNKQLNYAGANNPLWIVRNKELLEFLPDKMPVGKHDKDSVSFTQQVVTLQKDDVIYCITDGMPDQFGGPRGKKFMYKKLKETFISISHLPMHEQRSIIADELEKWKGDLEQVDDVCIIGVRM